MGTNNQSDAIILLIYVAYRKGDFKDPIPDKKIIQPAVSGVGRGQEGGKSMAMENGVVTREKRSTWKGRTCYMFK